MGKSTQHMGKFTQSLHVSCNYDCVNTRYGWTFTQYMGKFTQHMGKFTQSLHVLCNDDRMITRWVDIYTIYW